MLDKLDPPMVVPRYMARFRCVAGACDDPCCVSWDIPIDRRHYMKMRGALKTAPGGDEDFARSVKRVRKRSDQKFALFVLNGPEQRCGFWEEDRTCRLHAQYGEQTLPDACAIYPRRPVKVGALVEMNGSLSCPEVARLALLADDALVPEASDEGPPRNKVFDAWSPDEPDAYTRSLVDVRLALVQILEGAAPLAARLATVVALADAVGADFARGKRFDAARVARSLRDFASPAIGAQIADGLAAIDLPAHVPVRTLVNVLAFRGQFTLGTFAPLLKIAAERYCVDGASAEAVARAYADRRDALEPLIGARFERILAQYALHHTLSSWFTRAPDLGVWVRGLALRVALVRFLVFAHPAVAELDATTPPDVAAGAIERAAIDVIAKMSRAFEHYAGFLALLDRGLPGAMPGLEHALCLLKL